MYLKNKKYNKVYIMNTKVLLNELNITKITAINKFPQVGTMYEKNPVQKRGPFLYKDRTNVDTILRNVVEKMYSQ